MRRIVAVLAALALALSMAGSSLGAAPSSQVNRFVGNFDIVDFDMVRVVGHVVADITEPSAANLVPGNVTIYWKDGRPAIESHAQIVSASFIEQTWDDPYSPTGSFHAHSVLLGGSLCDYFGPSWGTCQPFAMIFQHITNGGEPSENKVGFSVPGTMDCCGGEWWPAGKGAWALTYVGPTFP